MRIEAPKMMVITINVLQSLDAMSVLKYLLAHFGYAKFISVVFWFGVLM